MMGKSRLFQEDFRYMTAPNHRYHDVSGVILTTYDQGFGLVVHLNYFLKIF